MVSEGEVKTHIAAAVRKADLNTVSAKQIRRNVEKELNLEQDELAAGKWKALVKTVIETTMAAIEQEPTENQKPQEENTDEEEIAPKKIRRKKAVIQATPESSPVKSKARSPAKLASPQPLREIKSNKRESIDLSESPKKKKQKQIADDESDSDMSVLNDSTPPTTKSRKTSTKEPKHPAKATSKSNAASKSTSSGPEDEIKHLKSLVFKCGVRKVWSKELPPTMSSSQQISHLEGILHSLGMTGRLSAEKAKKIKEERELREELDFIQEGARSVGAGGRRRSGI